MTDTSFRLQQAGALADRFDQVEMLELDTSEQGRAEYRRQFNAIVVEIQHFFTGWLQETGGELTPAVLEAADMFFRPRLAKHLAKILQIPLAQLSRLLARERDVECERCHRHFTVVENRTVGGSRYLPHPVCDDCLKLQSQADQAERKGEVGDLRRRIELNAQLAHEQHPLSLPAFTARLEELVSFWLSGKVLQAILRAPGNESILGISTNIQSVYPIGGGCMVCGATPVRMFWTNDNSPGQGYPFVELLDANDRQRERSRQEQRYRDRSEDGLLFAPVVRPAQLVARLDPQQFFTGVPHFPLRRHLLLILCDGCADLAEVTHTEVFPDRSYEPASVPQAIGKGRKA